MWKNAAVKAVRIRVHAVNLKYVNEFGVLYEIQCMKKLIPPACFLRGLSIYRELLQQKTKLSSPPPPSHPPVVVVKKKESHLPPGQAKKIYSEKRQKTLHPANKQRIVPIIVFNTSMKVIVTDGRKCYK